MAKGWMRLAEWPVMSLLKAICGRILSAWRYNTLQALSNPSPHKHRPLWQEPDLEVVQGGRKVQCKPQATCRGDASQNRRGANRDNVVSMCLGEYILHSVVMRLNVYTFFHSFLLLLQRTDKITSQARAVVPPTRY
jgi:hypothetical protein